jgi:hypothetical protein
VILLAGLLAFAIYSAGIARNIRCLAAVLLVLWLAGYAVMGCISLFELGDNTAVLLVLMVLISASICFSTLLSCSYLGAYTGVSLSRTSTVFATLIAGTAGWAAGLITGVWGLWGKTMPLLGICTSLFVAGVVVFLALMAVLVITACTILAEGCRVDRSDQQ